MTTPTLTQAPDTVMPPPPKGMVWVLRLDPMYDRATLWLFKKRRLSSGSSGWSIICESVRAPGVSRTPALKLSRVSTDYFVEGVVSTAHALIKEVGDLPGQKAAAEARAQELSERLGIRVEVKS